jgi:hypothetical protein
MKSLNNENSALPGHYLANSGNSLPTFRDKILVPSSRVKNPFDFGLLTHQNGINRLSRNVGKELPILVA